MMDFWNHCRRYYVNKLNFVYIAQKYSIQYYLSNRPPDNYVPSMCQLPMYVLRLASEVDWDDEKRCFQTIAREIATFYSYIPLYLEESKWKWIVEHVMYANIKQYLLPPEKFREIMLQIASLSHLYRVFERCWWMSIPPKLPEMRVVQNRIVYTKFAFFKN